MNFAERSAAHRLPRCSVFLLQQPTSISSAEQQLERLRFGEEITTISLLIYEHFRQAADSNIQRPKQTRIDACFYLFEFSTFYYWNWRCTIEQLAIFNLWFYTQNSKQVKVMLSLCVDVCVSFWMNRTNLYENILLIRCVNIKKS